MAHTIRISSNPTRFIFKQISPLLLQQSLLPKHTLLSFTKSTAHFSTMAADSETTFQTAVAPPEEDEDKKFGFTRDEMYKLNLAGTVDSHDRHLFLCSSNHEAWPTHVEKSESDPLPKLLGAALMDHRDGIAVKTRLTICEGGEDLKLADGDVLVFPEMVVYRGLKESNVDGFVKDVFVDGKSWESGVQEALTGSYVFVCAHNKRDRRCGVCGPVLIQKFKEEIESKDLKDQVFVTACSHIGGHKYAGNVIIFSTGPDGKTVGNWYGYVTPNDVLELLDKQIGNGEVIERIWRGQMGAPPPVKEAEKIEEPKQSNGTAVNGEKQPLEIPAESTTESVSSCCQGANGFSCCRDENVEPKSSKCTGGLSGLIGKFEQRHVVTTAAVLGAAAAVLVAYSVYRRSK